jgi:D-alanyl-D-alanine carboxypeptidase
VNPRRVLPVVAALAALVVAPGTASADQPGARLQGAIDRLVERPKGPPGAIVLVQRGRHRLVFRAGVADVETGAPMQPWKHMRIASTAKAYSGGVALSLVRRDVLSLNDTIGELLPWANHDWRPVTLGQALHHTSGLPDYSANKRFLAYLVAHLEDPLAPRRLLRFVGMKDLRFDPGTRYEYSNSDNIVIGLMVQAATGRPYELVLRHRVLGPLGLRHTTLPRGTAMPHPFIHGYDADGEDVSELVAAGYAWASGGIVSTPGDQNRFIRGYVGRRLFGRALEAAQFHFIPGGMSEPPGPGANAAGLGVFRYRTRCGTMYGHTGNIFGYTQFFAASRNARRSVVVSINGQTTPTMQPQVFTALRHVFLLAACEANGAT